MNIYTIFYYFIDKTSAIFSSLLQFFHKQKRQNVVNTSECEAINDSF